MSKMAIVNAMYISESDFPRELMTKKHHQILVCEILKKNLVL
jgi:hypothetical protein